MSQADSNELRSRLADAGVHTVEVALPDSVGHLRGKRVPLDHFISSVAYSHCNIADAVFVMDHENDLADSPFINMDTGFLDCSLHPDLSTLRTFSHRPGYAIVFAEARNEHGDLHPLSPRTVLAQQLEAASAAGLDVLAATELEAYLFNDDWSPIQEHVQYSSLTDSLHLEAVMADMRAALLGAGIHIEGSNFEYGPGQIEVNAGPADAMTCADNTILFKSIVKQVARSHGLHASFMPKPFAEASGNGLHTHTSLTGTDGNNAFADSNEKPNELMSRWLSGLMRHAADMTMLCIPTPNGYKRVRPFTFAPTHVNWGLDNRSVLARCICEPGSKANRIEFRAGGADANSYLVLAAIIAAGLDGLNNDYELREMSVGDQYSNPGDATPVPLDMAAAIEQYRSSELAGLLGADFSTNYSMVVEMELDKYNEANPGADADAVTEWEFLRYREFT